MKNEKTAKRAGKERLDKLLVDRGLVENRSRAGALIMAGKVKVNGERVEKSGTLLSPDCALEVDEGRRWASRGAFKLLKALDVFSVSVQGKVCADVGASTGGFTDVLLDRGAGKVYAVDVGYGQLLWRLAADPRVVVMDRTNARTLTSASFEEPIELFVCDASFISLKLLLPAMDEALSAAGEAVVLIKPQFEAGRERVKGGVVRDPEIHRAVLEEVALFVLQETRFQIKGLSWSPILGPEGNMEFLCHLVRGETLTIDIAALVAEAHTELVRK